MRAMTFACRGGLFVGGGILPKLAWRVPALGGVAAEAAGGCALLRGFLGCGPKMSGFVARVPLSLVEDADAGVKGCLYVAMSALRAADL
jgi:glucokinase